MRFAYLLGEAIAESLRSELLNAFHKSGRKIIYTAPSDVIRKVRSNTRGKRQKKCKCVVEEHNPQRMGEPMCVNLSEEFYERPTEFDHKAEFYNSNVMSLMFF